jgi:plastocyanin
MRKFFSVLFLCATLALTACGATGTTTGETNPTATTPPLPTPTQTTAATATPSVSAAATISFGRINFAGATNVTIKAGQAVLFDDPSGSGGTHDLVIGHNGQFSSMSGAPSELNSATGMLISPGQQQTIVFPSKGTFPITCTIHPSMQVTVTVTA